MIPARPRYDAIVGIANRLGASVPSMMETARWTTPAVSAPGFGLAVELRLLARARPFERPRRSNSTRHGAAFVYFISGADRIKIGLARNVDLRLAGLQTGSPVALEILLSIPGDLSIEHGLHTRFAALRTHGEWFRAEAPLVPFIQELKARRERTR
jgi:hypothetical protein